MLARALSTLARRGVPGRRALSSAAGEVEFDLGTPFKTHLCDGPESNVATSNKDELMGYLRDMEIIRRMEIACDKEYKVRNIRGFCHLYDGQEAVAVGVEAGMTRDDDWTTTYRCHATSYVRGDSVAAILAEQFGFDNGVVKGKGGSMHLYNKASNFWGGAGIVGAQIPVAVGIAFANKYKANHGADRMNVSMGFYGDGAANQGQVWEAANMAQLWKLPALFVIENNMYGMGTSVERHSSQPEYYKMGNGVIPGIQINGQDVLAVREGFKWAREHAATGKGPLMVEVKTYRYHGHSMSDPGLTYRDRDEVADVRATQDCILKVQERLLETNMATEEEVKAIEKEAQQHVKAQVKEAKTGKELPLHEMYTDIYHNEVPHFIRGAQIETSAVDGRSSLEQA
jgi:pyruvate dehydrogenase E1 component alpha subunit